MPKLICPYCNETQDIKLKVILDYVKDSDQYNDAVAVGRVKIRCRQCGRELVNHYFEE